MAAPSHEAGPETVWQEPDAGDLERLYRPIVLTEPNRLVFPPPWIGHVPFAFWIVDALRPRSLVELGTHSGNSYCAFLQAVARCGISTACYAVDTWEGDSHAGQYGDEIFADLSAHHDPLYAGFSRLLRMTFDQALEYFADGSIDLLHIDGLHTYEAVSHDVESWLPKMSGRGVVLMHDINVRERGFGVWRVWDEVCARYPSFSFLHSNGLGVAYVGREEMPEPLRWLMEAGEDHARSGFVRHGFSRLGQGSIDRFWAHHRIREIADRDTHITELKAQVVDREQTLETVRSWVDERDTHIAALKAEIDTRGQAIETLQARLADRDRRIVELDAEASERIGRLAGELAASGAELERQARELAIRADHAQRVEARLASVYRSTSWRSTAPLRWVGLRSRIAVAKSRFVLRIARQAMPLLARDPAGAGRGLTYLWKHGPRPAWRHLIQTVRGDAAEPPAGPVPLPAPAAPRENARPIEIDHSVAVPFAHRPPLPATPPSLAVVCHMFYEELAAEFRHYFRNIPVPFDIFVSTDDPFKAAVIEKAFTGWDRGRVEVRVTPNRGRDIAPKLLGFRDVYDRYELVLHLHSKQSHHASVLANWRGYLLENMLGSPEIVESVIGAFVRRPDLGMIASQHFEPVRHWINWGGNFPIAADLGRRMGIALSDTKVLDFPSGSMFWARSAALRPLLDLGLSYDDFAEETGQIDGTTAHAVERLYYHVCERAGFRWIKIACPTLFAQTPAIVPMEDEGALDRFIAAHGLALTGDALPAPREVHPSPLAQPADSLVDRRSAVALGLDHPIRPATRVAVGVVTYNNGPEAIERIIRSARLALEDAGCPTDGAILVIDNGAPSPTIDDPAVRRLDSQGNIGFGAGHNRLMAAAFAAGAEHYVAANPDGAFHPSAISALLRMMQANNGRALVESLQFPVEHPKPYDPFTFATPWISGACLMIPRSAFEELGGFDETFFMYCEDVDLSWRARANGFALRTCPTSLFLHEVTNRPRNPAVLRMIFESGVLLARKWDSPSFESWLGVELGALGHTPPDGHPAPVPAAWRRYADFTHEFRFAKTRW